MLYNFVKESVSVGGTGNLTTGGAVTGFIALNTAAGTDKFIIYTIEDGNDKEIGIGHLSASTTLVRDTVLETLVSGTYDNTAPSAINVTTAAEVGISSTAQSFGMHRPGAFYGGGMVAHPHGRESATTQSTPANYLYVFPMRWQAGALIDKVTVSVATSAAGANARIGIYEVESDGEPGKLIIDFTDTTELDCSSTGLKTATSATPVFLPPGDYFISLNSESTTVKYRASQYSTSSVFLGWNSAGTSVTQYLYRTKTYGALSSDETASTWTEGINHNNVCFVIGKS